MTLADRAKTLELERLLFEYEYLQSEYKRKETHSQIVDSLFHEQVNKYIQADKEITDKWGDFLKSKDEDVADLIKPQKKAIVMEKPADGKPHHSSFVKDIYRSIVKETHPDRINFLDSSKTELYIQATKAYDTSDLGNLLLVGIKCGIPLSNNEQTAALVDDLTKKIKGIRGRGNFLDVTIPWKWYQAPDIIKSAIIATYVKAQLS